MFKPYKYSALFLLVLLVLSVGKVNAQDKITFIAPDKLLVTADLYFINDTLPYMILCHDLKSSRGEYKDLAHRFNKLGYNCIALDLRVGATKNGVDNETMELAQAKHMVPKITDAQIDITGAINYVYSRSNKKMVLVGSGFSGALVLYIGATNPRIASVFAFSPTDNFYGALDTKTAFSKCAIPVFVASSVAESASTKAFVSSIPASKLTFFTPSGPGPHGTDALLTSSEVNHDYWLSILMYVHQIQGGS